MLPEMPAQSTARSLFQAPRLLRASPWHSKWFAAGPRAARSGATGAADLGGWRAGKPGCLGAGTGAARRCPARGLPPARNGTRCTSGSTATTLVHKRPSRRRIRGLQPRTRSLGRAPLFRSPTRSITPGRGKARARCPHPRSSAVTIKSQLLSKWGQH